jgi:hypothetical protein
VNRSRHSRRTRIARRRTWNVRTGWMVHSPPPKLDF